MRIVVCLFTLLLAACSTHQVRPVDITVTPENVSIKAPSFIAVGDSLTVRVKDERYANRYVARPAESDLVTIARAPLFGDSKLGKIDLKFQPSRTLAEQEVPPTRPEAFFADDKSELAEFQAASDELTTVSERVRARLDSLRAIVAADPAEYARLRLLEDDSWLSVAAVVLNDPAPDRAANLLDSLARDDTLRISPDTLESVRRDAERYARRLDALRSLLPAEPSGTVADNSRVGELLGALGRDVQTYYRLRSTVGVMYTRAQAARDDGEAPIAGPDLQPLPAAMRVSGIDIAPWLDRDSLAEALDEIQARVTEVNERTEKLALALNALPAWTRTDASEAIFTQIFPSEKQVRVVVVREDRYPRLTTSTGGATATTPAKKEGQQAAAESGLTVTTTTTVRQAGDDDASVSNEGDSGAAEAAGQTAASSGQSIAVTSLAVPRAHDTVAVVNIPVLQRYRFHLGVGMVYSTLETGVFETRPDTIDEQPGVNVVRVGTDENRLLPMAMLSYTLYPFGGRFVDGRAYRTLPILLPNVSVQAGISLTDPTEHLYAGLSAEFFPGVDIGAGYHFGYVTTTPNEGKFVPDSEPATSQKWLNDWAYSLTLDAATFITAFGALFGLRR